MIRIFKLVVLLVISQVAFGQAPSNYVNINGRYRWIAGMFDSTFHIPKGSTPSLRTGGSTNSGGLFYNTSDSSVYTYTGTQWIKLRGSINPSDTTNKYVTQVYKKSGSDSIFYVKGGNHLFAFVDSVGSPGGGGGGKVYYFNGGVSMGTFGGFTMYELGDTANTGAAANFTRSTTGNIANFITDSNKPGLLQIPAGVWSVDAWLSETGGGANHAEIWVEVEKWDGSTITTIATSPIEQITEGATPNLYSWSVSIPTTSLTVTNRIIIQFYISNTNGKTVTLYTQNGYVGEVHTTFTTGIGAINGLTAPAQYLVTGTSGTDFNINSSTATHTFNLPTASSMIRGALSPTDWSAFNNKIGPSDTASMLSPYLRSNVAAATYVPLTRTITINGTSQDLSANRTYNVGTVTSVATNTGTGITGGTITSSGTLAIDTLLISTRAWRQKGVDSVASLINTRISGTTNYIPKFTSSSAIGNSIMYEGTNAIGIGTTSPTGKLTVNTGTNENLSIVTGGSGDLRIAALNDAASSTVQLSIQGSPLLFRIAGGLEAMRLDASGNLGLGTSSPASKFHIAGADAWITLQRTSGTTNILDYTNSAGSRLGYVGYIGNDLALNNATASNTIFYTSGSERMRITSGGDVGIGTTSPDWLLKIEKNSSSGSSGQYPALVVNNPNAAGYSAMYFFNGSTNVGGLEYSNASTNLNLNAYGALIFQTSSGTERMRITSGGNVGIGTSSITNPISFIRALNISGGDAGIIFSNTNGTAKNWSIGAIDAGSFVFFDGSTERMRITSGGELLINTTSDAGDYKLQVNGNTYTNGSLTTAAPSGGNAAAWKLGERVASAGVTFNDQQYIQLDIGGTLYYLATVDLPMPEAYPQATSGPSNNYKMAPVQVKTTRDAEIEKLRKEIEELKQLIKNK